MAKRRGPKSEAPAPLTPGGVEAIEQLASRWLRARPVTGGLGTGLVPVEVPAGLAETLTSDVKAGALALDDARWWLALTTASGLGLEIFLLNADELGMSPSGDRQLQPARFAMTWVDRKGPATQETTTREEVFASLVHERGQWRVRALWTKAERREAASQRETLRRLMNTLPS